MMGWQWHQLELDQVICTLLKMDNQLTMPALQFFFTGRTLFLSSDNSVKALKSN